MRCPEDLGDWSEEDQHEFYVYLFDALELFPTAEADEDEDDYAPDQLGQVFIDEPTALVPAEFDEYDDDQDELPAQLIVAVADDVIQAIFDDVDEVDAEIEDLLAQFAPELQQTDGAKWPVPRGGKRKRKPEAAPVRPRDLDRLPEDIAREQRMLEEYVASLEKKEKRLERAPARERKKAEREIPVPRLTDAMARAASAEQLMAIIRAVSAVELDRQRAAEEKRRRMLMAVLLLALD